MSQNVTVYLFFFTDADLQETNFEFFSKIRKKGAGQFGVLEQKRLGVKSGKK